MASEPDRPRSGSGRQQLHLGIIGFGQLAQSYYVPALRGMTPGLVISVADPLERSRAAARRALPDARLYDHHRALLAGERADGLLVASPPSTHLEIWSDAATQALPVFMEKPFLMAGELERIDPTDGAWRNLMIDFNRRFWPAYRDLSTHLANGSLGRVSEAQFTLHIDSSAWAGLGDHRSDPHQGGALYDLGSHTLDLVFMTFPERPMEILAKRSGAGTPHERIELELGFGSDLVVRCDLAYGRRNREKVSIRGDLGTLRLENPNGRPWMDRAGSRLGRWSSAGVDLALLGYRGAFRSQSMLRFSVRAALQSFVSVLIHGGAFRPDFADAHRVARWTAAADHSIAVGRSVREHG